VAHQLESGGNLGCRLMRVKLGERGRGVKLVKMVHGGVCAVAAPVRLAESVHEIVTPIQKLDEILGVS
jgi:hypothetical protein